MWGYWQESYWAMSLGLSCVDLIENCGDLPPSSAALRFTGRNPRRINQTRKNCLQWQGYMGWDWGCIFANWIVLTWKDTPCTSLINSVWVPCLLSQNNFCKSLWKNIFSIVCHFSYRGQWSTICLSFSNGQTDLDFQPKMNYPGKIMQTNCSTETECNGQPGDAT